MQKRTLALAALLALLASSAVASEMGTAFTYQGRLCDGGVPANGYYDFTFRLYAEPGDPPGSALGAETHERVFVANGLFTTNINLGAGMFTGSARWLEILARTNGVGDPLPLGPRQELKPAPYALYAANAATAASAAAVPWGGIAGIPADLSDGDNDTTYSAGPGLTLVGTTLSLDTNYLGGQFWRLGGNAGTTAGTHFVGTADNQPLELQVNRDRALRLEPTATGGTVNFIGGSRFNVVSGSGATIAGGGTSNSPNKVLNSYGTIAGGIGQTVVSAYGMIGGGLGNEISMNSGYATVGGGSQNRIATYATASTIVGGSSNLVTGTYASRADQSIIGGGLSNTIQNAGFASIGGGATNAISTDALYSTIAGGRLNQVGDSSEASAIGGGRGNLIGTNSSEVAIGGGHQNSVGDNAMAVVVVGGYQNAVGVNSDYSMIGGGIQNSISNDSPRSAIAGGAGNHVANVAERSFIGAGDNNDILAGAGKSAIVGGSYNSIGADCDYSFIGGGYDNDIAPSALYSTLAGGYGSEIGTNCTYSAVSGGFRNAIGQLSTAAVIGGGWQNVIETNADYATIPGGKQAKASCYGQFAHASGWFAAQGDAQASMFVLRRTTTSATPTELALDNGTARIVVPKRSTWAFDILIVGRHDMAGNPPPSYANSAAYQIRGVAMTEDTLTYVSLNAANKTVLFEDIAAWDATVEADAANNELLVKVTGSAGMNVRWVANVRTVEVTFP